MNVPADVPEWFWTLLEDRAAMATLRVRAADTIEKLWTAKGAMDALMDLKDDVNLKAIENQVKERERVEEIINGGN